MRSFTVLKHWASLALSVVLAYVLLHFWLAEPLGQSFSAALGASQSKVLVSLLSVFLLSSDILLPIPSSIIAVATSLALGWVLGFFAIWLGLSLSCVIGYWLGSSTRAWVIGHFFKASELHQVQQFSRRWGGLSLVVLRAVPILAEASVVAAGITRIPFKTFLGLTALSNAGLALVYALVAAYAQTEASFLLAFAASVTLPLVALALFKLLVPASLKQASRSETLKPSFTVNFRFPLCFTRDVFALANPTLAEQLAASKDADVKAVFFVDQGLIDATPKLADKLNAYCQHWNIDNDSCVHSVPGGDAAKSQTQIDLMYQRMLDVALDRQSYVVAIGGGGVLDAVGYAAATFHRGIRLIRMPTTVLAQNDAGVGVKNGINALGIKNLYGSFAVPTAIINDEEFLTSLSQRDYRSGFAEAIKVGLIRDAEFFHWICSASDKLNQRDKAASYHLIKRCAELHLHQICNGGDPFELGSARPLDYGHWSAHKLEALTKHALSHGEAVAIGMSLDALYAVEVGLLNLRDAETIIELINTLGFNVWHPALLWEAPASGGNKAESLLVKGLEEFRQHLGGELCITLLTGFGKTVEVNQIDTDALLRARDKLLTYENPQSASLSSELLQQHSPR